MVRRYVSFLPLILAIVSLAQVCRAQTPKRPPSAKPTRRDAVKAFSAQSGMIVFAEVDPATVEALAKPSELPGRKITADSVAKMLGCNERQQSENRIYFQRARVPAPNYRMDQGFTNELNKLTGLNKFLQSLSPEQWQRLQDDRGHIPAGLLTGTQKGYLTGLIRPPESPNAIYEFDFRTWMGTRTADGTVSMSILKRTAPKQ